MVLMGLKIYWDFPLASAYQLTIIEIPPANQITVILVMGIKMWFLLYTCKRIQDITKTKKSITYML